MSMTPEPRWWRLVGALVLLAGVVVRAWPWLEQPLLAWEDGTLFFAVNYAEFRPEQCVMPYQGYVPFGSNVLAILLCRLPTEWIATSFCMAAVVIYAASAAAFLRPAWQSVAPFGARLLVAVTVAWLPFGSNLEFTTLAYSQWPMLWWLFLLLIEPGREGEHGCRQVGQGLLAVALALSHPLAVTLAPLVCLPGVWLSQRLRWSFYLGAIAGYWLVAAVVVPDSTQLSLRHLATEFWPMMASRVAFEAVAGGAGRQALAGIAPWLSAVAGTVLWLLFAAGLAKAWRSAPAATRRLLVALLWLAVVTVAASLVGRQQLRSQDAWIVRYVWLARLAFLVAAQLVVARLLGWRWCVLAMAMLAMMLGFANRAWHHHPGENDRIRAFVQELCTQEREQDGRRWIRASIPRREDGSMVVVRPF